jgi:membrane-associated phospholipid phosphatase
MNAESSRLRSTGTISTDMGAIWPGALLVAYLAGTGILLLSAASRLPRADVALHFGVLGAIAAATWLRGVPRWLRLWSPLIALLFLYSEMPLLIQAAGHAELLDATVIRWESIVFGGQPALAWAARWPSAALSEVLHLAYLSYYAIIFSVPAGLYLASRHAEFSEAVFVLMLTFVACFMWYIAFPVAGPRYLWPPTAARELTGGPVRSLVIWLLEARSSEGTAFPSSHMAVSVAQSILAVRYFGAKGWVVAVLTAGLGLGAIYGGFHFAIDVVVGAALGAVIAGAGLGMSRWLTGRFRQANATAPT